MSNYELLCQVHLFYFFPYPHMAVRKAGPSASVKCSNSVRSSVKDTCQFASNPTTDDGTISVIWRCVAVLL